MRCLALAEGLADFGWHVRFAVDKETISTLPTLAESRVDVCVLPELGP